MYSLELDPGIEIENNAICLSPKLKLLNQKYEEQNNSMFDNGISNNADV